MEAGTVIQVDGASIDVLADAAFQIAGTEADPVVFTSAQASPEAGDGKLGAYLRRRRGRDALSVTGATFPLAFAAG